MKLMNWLEENYNVDDHEDMIDSIVELCYDSDIAECEVTMGYMNNECVAYGYFNNEYPLYARLTPYKDVYILSEDEQYPGDYVVFTSLEDGLQAIKKLEDTLEVGIDVQIERFRKKLDDYSDTIDIEVKREFNNGGHFYSFNVLFQDDLLIDGAFYLDAEEVLELVEKYDEITEELYSYKIFIDRVYKNTDSIGFNKSYIFELSKKDSNGDWEYNELEIPIIGMQGQTRNITNYLCISEILDMFDN